MKAVTLISGGLDSILATKLTQNLGIELIAMNTISPFCLCNRHSRSGCLYGASRVARELNLKLVSINIAEEFLEIVRRPKHGYGSNMNPCIDCRILLFRKAKTVMQKEGASFVITGEVLGQRPMSQRLDTMKLIERETGLEGMVVRPLSAKVLEPTFPEKQGWIKRDNLLAINGRGRKGQIRLAHEFGINDYPCPSGGCLLTDPEFSRRLKDLMKEGEFNLNDIQLLKIGRHFRLRDTVKLVVGRNEGENGQLVNFARGGDYLFSPAQELAGPTALGRGLFTQELIRIASSVTCRYCDLNGKTEAEIFYRKVVKKDTGDSFLRVVPLSEEELASLRI